MHYDCAGKWRLNAQGVGQGVGMFRSGVRFRAYVFPGQNRMERTSLGEETAYEKPEKQSWFGGVLEGQPCSSSNTKYFYPLALFSFCPASQLPFPFPSCFPFHSIIVRFDWGIFSLGSFFMFLWKRNSPFTWGSVVVSLCRRKIVQHSDPTVLAPPQKQTPSSGVVTASSPPTPAPVTADPVGLPALDISYELNCTIRGLFCLAAFQVSSTFQHDRRVFYFIDVPQFYLFAVRRWTLLVIVGSALCALMYKLNALQILVFS